MNKNIIKKKPFTASLPLYLYKKIENIARENGESKNAIVTFILKKYFDK